MGTKFWLFYGGRKYLQSRRAIIRPLPVVGKGEGHVKFSDCRVRTETMKDEEGISQVKLVSEQNFTFTLPCIVIDLFLNK